VYGSSRNCPEVDFAKRSCNGGTDVYVICRVFGGVLLPGAIYGKSGRVECDGLTASYDSCVSSLAPSAIGNIAGVLAMKEMRGKRY
jgi:hypothetical protein